MMKKLKFLFAIVVVLCMTVSVAFASDSDYTFNISNIEISGSDNVKVYINTDKVIAFGGNPMITGTFFFDKEVWEYVSSSDSNTFPAPPANSNAIDFVYEIVPSSTEIGWVEFKLKDGADLTTVKPFSLEILDFYDDDKDYTSTITGGNVTVKKTDVVIAAEANREVAGYTDVVNFSSSLTNVTATAPTLTFDLYENGVKHNVKPYEVNLGNGVTLDGSTLNFKIVVLGAPTDTTITLVNPAVK